MIPPQSNQSFIGDIFLAITGVSFIAKETYLSNLIDLSEVNRPGFAGGSNS